MIDNILFILVFLGQILLGSYYIPKEILIRIQKVCTKYPPEQYPKLYPESIEQYYRGQARYKVINEVILGLGLVILGMVIHYDFSNQENISVAIPALFFMIQFIPLIVYRKRVCVPFCLMKGAMTFLL